jgi:hypothetical protein
MSHHSQTLMPTTKDRAKQAQRIEPPVMSAAEQTRLSWARLIRSVEELPEVFRPFVAALPTAGAFPYAVITPTFAGFVRRENEKLVCNIGDRLYAVEKVKGELITTCYAVEDIYYLEVGSVLLNAWLQIRGRTSDGTFAAVRFKFNAVGERLFTPFIEQIRGVANYPLEIDREADLKKLGSADLLTFKFKNYARRSILPGAQINAVISQPEIRRMIVKVLGRSFQRTVGMSHILILTDRELIIIHDDQNSPKWVDDTRYGGVWDYVPLNKIAAVDLVEQETGLLAITVQLPHNDHVDVLFLPDRRAELERFVAQFKSHLTQL